jgi:hypothetical protein
MMGFFMIYLSPQPRYQQQIPQQTTTTPPKK